MYELALISLPSKNVILTGLTESGDSVFFFGKGIAELHRRLTTVRTVFVLDSGRATKRLFEERGNLGALIAGLHTPILAGCKLDSRVWVRS